MSGTMADAVSVYRRAVEGGTQHHIKELKSCNIDDFLSEANAPTFVHLLANATLLLNAKIGDPDFIEARLVALVKEITGERWCQPICLSLLELRYCNLSLERITDIEKRSIADFYDISEVNEKSPLYFHRTGTTSIIFTVGSRAIKVIRPVYLIDEEIASLHKYRDDYRAAPSSPQIHEASPYAMSMDWVKGETIEELISGKSTGISKPQAVRLISLISRLIEAIHKADFPHGDLSVKNIIVKDWSSDSPTLVLIDYGFNYSLTKPVLSSQAFFETARYVAPTPANQARNAFMDDVYSAAVVMLDCWFGKTGKSPYELVHSMAKEQPVLATILESALSEDPSLRGGNYVAAEGDEKGRSLDFFKAIGVACSKPAQMRVREKEAPLFSAVFKDGWQDVVGLVDDPRDDEEEEFLLSRQGARNKRLSLYRAICLGVTSLVVAVLGIVTMQGLSGEGWSVQLRQQWSEAGNSLTSTDAGIWALLPGYAICFSFSLVAAKYYLNVFSSASAYGRGQRVKYALASEFTMRLNSFAYTIPITYCFLLDPKSWPFCSAIGLLIVASNNYATKWFLSAVRSDKNFHRMPIALSSEASSNFDVFSGWGNLVASFAVGIALSGVIIISSSQAENYLINRLVPMAINYNVYEYLIAFAIIGINYIKMQRENCGKLAPSIRTMILRHIEASFVLSKLRVEERY